MNSAAKNSRVRKLVAGTLVTLTLGVAIAAAPADTGAISVTANRVSRGDSASVVEFKMAAETPAQNSGAYQHPRIGFTEM